jgi:hypothetical protein
MNGPGSVENQGHSLEQKKIAPDSDVGLNLPITANHWRDIPAQHEFCQTKRPGNYYRICTNAIGRKT